MALLGNLVFITLDWLSFYRALTKQYLTMIHEESGKGRG